MSQDAENGRAAPASDADPAGAESASDRQPGQPADAAAQDAPPREVGGRKGPDPTRYGDWEKNGRCIDF